MGLQRIISESGKFRYARTSHCAGAYCACNCVRLPRSRPATARSQCRYAHLQDGSFYRTALWIPSAHGLPVCSQRSQPAGSICWCDGHNWSRRRDYGGRGHGVGVFAPTAGPRAERLPAPMEAVAIEQLAFMISGWSEAVGSVDNQVWLRVGLGWKTAWRYATTTL